MWESKELRFWWSGSPITKMQSPRKIGQNFS
jgi:hypothetical protein